MESKFGIANFQPY